MVLTRKYGRFAARAHGVRRLLSRRGSGLLPLHRSEIVWEERAQGRTIVSATCMDSYSPCWQDPHAFSCAHQGVELVLKLTEECSPLPEVFGLTVSFLTACKEEHPSHLVQAFMLQLFHLLGSLPSVTHSSLSHRPFSPADQLVFNAASGTFSTSVEDQMGQRVSPGLQAFLPRILAADLRSLPPCSHATLTELQQFIQSLLGNQLGISLVSSLVNLSFSPGAMPI